MDVDRWNERHAAKEIEWDVEPAGLLAQEFRDIPPRGRVLDLACGRGRNPVWLASLGWEVTAVDYSAVALDHARQLASARGVNVEWVQADVTEFTPFPGAFQLVVIAYLHLPGVERRQVLDRAARALAVGGTLFMVGHARLNLTEGAGGPRDPDVLWEPADIERELSDVGLLVQRVHHVYRPADMTEGAATAIDTVARAERP
jgi:SAM-dependent methyltransferase